MTTDEIAAKLYAIYYKSVRAETTWERESIGCRRIFEGMAEWVQWQLQRVNAGKSVEYGSYAACDQPQGTDE